MRACHSLTQSPLRLYHLARTPTPTVVTMTLAKCRQRQISTSNSPDILDGFDILDVEAIKSEMLARKPQSYFDELLYKPSDLFHIALQDFFPDMIPNGKKSAGTTMPAGQHLLYFPLTNSSSKLCPDGTDPWSMPLVEGFTRRVWASGSIKGMSKLRFRSKTAICHEHIEDVSVKGPAGNEKISVHIARQYKEKHRLDTEDLDTASEHRTLVFMRKRHTGLENEQIFGQNPEERRFLKSKQEAAHSLTLTPTRALLFQYSALTYNAHLIHIDPTYCREVEGYRAPLVHGPLSVMFMLELLRSFLNRSGGPGSIIDSFSYRLLVPLYVDEPMRICLAPGPLQTMKLEKTQEEKLDRRTRRKLKYGESKEDSIEEEPEPETGPQFGEMTKQKWDLWIENQHGRMCAKGVAETIPVNRRDVEASLALKTLQKEQLAQRNALKEDRKKKIESRSFQKSANKLMSMMARKLRASKGEEGEAGDSTPKKTDMPRRQVQVRRWANPLGGFPGGGETPDPSARLEGLQTPAYWETKESLERNIIAKSSPDLEEANPSSYVTKAVEEKDGPRMPEWKSRIKFNKFNTERLRANMKDWGENDGKKDD
ncbi:hypothetical protein F5Y16DRAFT_19029 [Xylariaceae sp. FL0255]|nr:hypothetical protein F5Y16DRAFT_19029 [Xylariaceae sp. FL0255]